MHAKQQRKKKEILQMPGAHSQPSQTFKMELLLKLHLTR